MLHIRREILRKNNGKSRFFHHSPSLYGSFLVLCRVFFRRGCQNCHRIVPRNSLVESNSFRIKFFSGHWAKFLRPCGNFFQVELSKLYVSIERFSEQIFFENISVFIIILGHWWVLYRLSGKYFLPSLSKLQPICLEEQFKEKNLFRRN